MATSIKQKLLFPAGLSVPYFRNLGVILRIFVLVNLMALVTVMTQSNLYSNLFNEIVVMAGQVELPLFTVVALLFLLAPLISRSGAWVAPWIIIAIVLAAILFSWIIVRPGDATSLLRWSCWAVGASVITLLYFDYRNRLLSPSLSDARLLALTARIRPHFLFNSLNGVLGVIRSDPKRAESALEELSDLLRVFMRDNREMLPLHEEIRLCNGYLDLEKLRLGDRLTVRWEIVPGQGVEEALIPPLIIQPLLENAVYYGVEPSADNEEIRVRVWQRENQLWIEVDNPVVENGNQHHLGNRMALENIRERLALFFDLEAGLDIRIKEQRYRARIHLPFRRVQNESGPATGFDRR